jgi:rubredoxin
VPQPLARRRRLHATKVSPTLLPMTTETATTRWICESCGFIYDPDEGDPDGGIPPGTAFEDIPDTWFCPVCGARKKDFSPYED